jgi:pimeloyl-ACP methyl ester carboxylesterase
LILIILGKHFILFFSMQAISSPQLLSYESDLNGVKAHLWTNFEQRSWDLPGEAETVVFGHGAFGTDRLFRPLVGGILTAAHEAGMPLVVVTYEDPPTSTAYKPAERVSSLGKIVLGAAGLLGRPVNLIGHSWGAVNAVNVAAAFVDEPNIIKTLTLHTPIGYAGEHAPHSVPDFVGRALKENFGPKEPEGHSLRTDLVLAVAMAERFTRAPATTIRAIVGAMCADQLVVSEFHRQRTGYDEKLAKLQRIPLKAVVALGDALFPAQPTADNLRAQGFKVSEISCNHPEAIKNSAKGRELFRIIFEQ